MTPENQGDTDPKDKEFADGYERRKAREKMRELEQKVAELEGKLVEKEWDFDEKADPRIKKLVLEHEMLKREFDTVLEKTIPEDESLEPFMQRVMMDHGERLKKAYPNRLERLEAVRTMARGLEAEEAQSKSNVSGRSRESATSARVHLTGGGPSASRRGQSSNDDWLDFKRKMADPKLSRDEKKALADKWDMDHPEE